MFADGSDTLIFDEESYNAGSNLRYSFIYRRYKNSIPVKDNSVSITVCITDDGSLSVRNMSANINYKAEFADNKAEIENLTGKYMEAFPIELVYRNDYNYDWKETGKPRNNPVLIYRIKDNDAGFISAETGEVVKEDISDELYAEQEATADAAGGMLMSKNESGLTERELEEISVVEGLLSVSEIEKKVKSLPYISFPENVKMGNSRLSRNDEEKYIYNIYYNNKDDSYYSYANLSADAESGALKNWYRSGKNEVRKDIALSENQKKAAQSKITEFLNAAAPEEIKASVLERSEENKGYLNEYYYREVNGIKHINNGISVSFDARNSFVTNFSLNFADGVFESPEKAIGGEKAYENLLAYSPIEKLYVKSGGKYIVCATLKKRGVTLDALTGEIENVYRQENSSFYYDDIKGHWAEEAAEKLAEIQLGFEGGKLNPDMYVTQEDFFRLVASGIYGKYYHTLSRDELYEALVRDKIIEKDEKNPDAEITRENAFVYMIRMANLERVAKLENIYKVEYADSEMLSQGKIGYCAILSGLGVINGSGGYLRPQDKLTRAETVVMLYRYLLKI